MTITKINNIIDQKTVEVGSYPFSIQAIERVNPANATYSNGVAQRQNPLNIKIKIQNTQRKVSQNGVMAVLSGSKKLRSLNSDQTIMSFDLVRENSLLASTKNYGSKFVKLLMPGKCLKSKAKDDNYSYVPSDIEINKNKYIAKFSKDNKLQHGVEDDLPPIIILGKCKPGGCLDPVFSEDKFTYTQTKKAIKISEDSIRDTKTSQDKKKTITYNKVDEDVIIKQKESPLKTNNISSEAIITYPIAPSSGEIKTRRKSNEKSLELKNKDYKTFTKYQNELTEVFFRPSKTEELSRETSLKGKVNNSDNSNNQVDNESTSSVTHSISESLQNNVENHNGFSKSLSTETIETVKNNDPIYDKMIPKKYINTKITHKDNLKSVESNSVDINDKETNKIESLSEMSTNHDNSQNLKTQSSLPEILSFNNVKPNTSKHKLTSKTLSRDDFEKLEARIKKVESVTTKNEKVESNLILDDVLSIASLQQDFFQKCITKNVILESTSLPSDDDIIMKSISATNTDVEKHIKLPFDFDTLEKNIIKSKDSEKDLSRISKETVDRLDVTKSHTKSLSSSSKSMPKQNSLHKREYNNENVIENKNGFSIDSSIYSNINDKSKNSRLTEQSIFQGPASKYNIIQGNVLTDVDLLNNKSAHEERKYKKQSLQVLDKTDFTESGTTENTLVPSIITTDDVANGDNKKNNKVKSAEISKEGLELNIQESEETIKSTDSKSTLLQMSADVTAIGRAHIISTLPSTQAISNRKKYMNESQTTTIKTEHVLEEKDTNAIEEVDLMKNTFSENFSVITPASVNVIKNSSYNIENLPDNNLEKYIGSKNINKGDEVNNQASTLINTEFTFAKNMFNKSMTDLKENNTESFHKETPTSIKTAFPQIDCSLNEAKMSLESKKNNDYNIIIKNRKPSLNKKPRPLDYEEGQLSVINELFERKTLSEENIPILASLMYDNFLGSTKSKFDQKSLVTDDEPQNNYESIDQDQTIDKSSIKLKKTKEPVRLATTSTNSRSISSHESDANLKIAEVIRLAADKYVSSTGKKTIVESSFDSVKTLELSDKNKNENYILLNLGFESFVNNNNQKIINTSDPFLKPSNNSKHLFSFIKKTAPINDNLIIPVDSDIEINIAVNSKRTNKINSGEDAQNSFLTEKLNHNDIQLLIRTLHDQNLVPVKNIIEQLTKDIQFIHYNNLQRTIKIKSSNKSLNQKRRSLKCCKCNKRRIKNVIANKTTTIVESVKK